LAYRRGEASRSGKSYSDTDLLLAIGEGTNEMQRIIIIARRPVKRHPA